MVYLPSTEFPSWKGPHLRVRRQQVRPRHDSSTSRNPLFPDHPALAHVGRGVDPEHGPRPANRKIFTWDPTTKSLIEVTSANITALASLGGAGFTTAVVDFIRGNDGAGNSQVLAARAPHQLGPRPRRRPVGLAPGYYDEPQALRGHVRGPGRPPLGRVEQRDDARLPDRGRRRADRPRPAEPPRDAGPALPELPRRHEEPEEPGGQPTDTDAHLYGVANSFRFGDVWDGTLASPNYRTIGLISVGAGGDDIIAVDVTTVPKPDAASYPSDPVTVLWTKDSADAHGPLSVLVDSRDGAGKGGHVAPPDRGAGSTQGTPRRSSFPGRGSSSRRPSS